MGRQATLSEALLRYHWEVAISISCLSGLHGPGTRAIDLILREPPTAMLEKATHQIAGAPYYQMLVHLDTTPDERGECFPCQPELVEARALIIQ